MKRILKSTAAVLVLASAALLAATPVSAQCVPVAALDFNGDGWVDTPERHVAMDAGFQDARQGGKLHIASEELGNCLQGSQAAFDWLANVNPTFAGSVDAVAPAAGTTTGAVNPDPQRYYETFDAGAATDTPSPVAHEHAMTYLKNKFYGTPQ